MKKLLVKLFIKNYQDTSNPVIRAKYGSLAGIVGICVNILLFIVKVIAGIVSGSISIITDGINNLTDASSSIITLVGFKMSTKPADEDHPFGHQRIEYLTGVIISFIILFIGIFLGIESVKKLIDPSMPTPNIFVYIILGVSILGKLWLAIFNRKMSKDIDSSTLKATSQDSLNDSISTTVVLIVNIICHIFATTPFLVYLDGLTGIALSIMILVSGIKTLKETMDPLIGSNPTKEDVEKISKIVESYEGVLGIHDLVIHNYGPNKTFASIHVEVDAKVDVMISHDLMDVIERDVRDNHGIDLTIHMDPVNIDDEETIKTKEKVIEIVKRIDESLTIHDFRMVKGITHTNILFDIAIPIKFKMTKQELRKYLSQEIKELDEKYMLVLQIDQMYDRG